MALTDVTATGALLATAADLANLGISEEVTGGIQASTITAILTAATETAGAILQSSGRVKLPLTAWGGDIKSAVAKMAAWDVMCVRIGHNPEDPNNFVWRDRDAAGRAYLEQVARGFVMPVGLVDATPTDVKTGTEIYTETQRGW